MDFKANKDSLNRELEKFLSMLEDLLPRYSALLRKKNISKLELTELGEIEHYLIEVNAKISSIKGKLEEDLFGELQSLVQKTARLRREMHALARDHARRPHVCRLRTGGVSRMTICFVVQGVGTKARSKENAAVARVALTMFCNNGLPLRLFDRCERLVVPRSCVCRGYTSTAFAGRPGRDSAMLLCILEGGRWRGEAPPFHYLAQCKP